MSDRMKHRTTAEFLYSAAIRLGEVLIGSLLVLSAWLHLQNHLRFYIHVAQYQILPDAVLPYFVLTAPWVLLFTGMLIITRSGRPLGSVIGICLFFVFTLAQLWVILMGDDIDCGCFGGLLSEKVGIATASRAALLCTCCLLLTSRWYREQYGMAKELQETYLPQETLR